MKGPANPHEFGARDMSAKSKDARGVCVTDNLGVLLQDTPIIGPTLATKRELEPASLSALLQDGLYVALPSPDTGVEEVLPHEFPRINSYI